ncbi:exodeoxyribonuclease VII small subunit [Micrococcus luteus]|nr:exodeoxyribonuclease VII small subunit [Micrococcus luteus]
MSEQGMEQTQDAGRPSGVEGFTSADVSDVAQMSYEQARAELVETVGRLETGGAGLEESLALWERGEALADRCQAWLDGARVRLDQVRGEAAPDVD